MKTGISVLFLALALSLSARAAEVLPLFSAQDFIEDMGNFMLTDLSKKIGELSQTFEPRASGNFVADKTAMQGFWANEQDVCDRTKFVGAVASIAFTAKKNKDVLTQAIYYRGCDQGTVQFAELIQTKGGKLATLSASDILNVNRKFTLQDDETYRKYAILDGDQTEIFSFTSVLSAPRTWRTTIQFQGAVVATFSIWPGPKGENIEISKYVLDVDSRISKGAMAFNDASTMHYGISFFQSNQIYRNLETNLEVSFASMNTDLTTTLRTTLSGMIFKAVISVLLSDFPKSAPVITASQLKNDITYLRSIFFANPKDPKNVDQLLNYFTIWTKAIDAGDIKDSRPLK